MCNTNVKFAYLRIACCFTLTGVCREGLLLGAVLDAGLEEEETESAGLWRPARVAPELAMPSVCGDGLGGGAGGEGESS